MPPEVVEYFKSEGTGWQTKIGYALKDWIKQHPHSQAAIASIRRLRKEAKLGKGLSIKSMRDEGRK